MSSRCGYWVMSSRDDVSLSDWVTVEPSQQSSTVSAAPSRQHLASSTSALLHSKGARRQQNFASRPQQAAGHAITPQTSPKVSSAAHCTPSQSTGDGRSKSNTRRQGSRAAQGVGCCEAEEPVCCWQIWIAGILALSVFWCFVSLLAISRLEKRLPSEVQDQLEFHTSFSGLWPKAQGAAAGSMTAHRGRLSQQRLHQMVLCHQTAHAHYLGICMHTISHPLPDCDQSVHIEGRHTCALQKDFTQSEHELKLPRWHHTST